MGNGGGYDIILYRALFVLHPWAPSLLLQGNYFTQPSPKKCHLSRERTRIGIMLGIYHLGLLQPPVPTLQVIVVEVLDKEI